MIKAGLTKKVIKTVTSAHFSTFCTSPLSDTFSPFLSTLGRQGPRDRMSKVSKLLFPLLLDPGLMTFLPIFFYLWDTFLTGSSKSPREWRRLCAELPANIKEWRRSLRRVTAFLPKNERRRQSYPRCTQRRRAELLTLYTQRSTV